MYVFYACVCICVCVCGGGEMSAPYHGLQVVMACSTWIFGIKLAHACRGVDEWCVPYLKTCLIDAYAAPLRRRMLTYAEVCWSMLTYADVCPHTIVYDACLTSRHFFLLLSLCLNSRLSHWCMMRAWPPDTSSRHATNALAYADVCWRMPSY
jgi:hypothetical protein